MRKQTAVTAFPLLVSLLAGVGHAAYLRPVSADFPEAAAALPAAEWAEGDVDFEDALQPPCPGQRRGAVESAMV